MPPLFHSAPHRPALRRLAAAALFCCAGVAQAQFVWITPNGTRQYSDQPPPPGTPAAKILKAPGRPPAPLAPLPEAAATATAAAPKAPTLAEREADYRKRARLREEAELKAQKETERVAAQRLHCEDLRKTKRAYDSGIRIAEVGADGQQRFLGDAERTRRTARLDKALADCR